MKAFQEAKNILAYAAVGCEADMDFLIRHCFSTGRRVFLPVLTGPGVFEAREYRQGDTLIQNKHHIPESVNGQAIAPEELGFITVPGVAFDKRLHRIGYGAGYYDRYLPLAKNAFKAGAAYAFQVVDRIGAELHDVPLDALVTERDVFYKL
jgi:5-formyltetrahydrofolate cyclo-ligase